MSAGLADLQSRMQAHVLRGDGAALPDAIELIAGAHQPGGLSPAQRLGIYHHAYRARLLDTLRDSFGHTLLYLGDDSFEQLAEAFIEQHPSAHHNLRWYGEVWPESLAEAHPEVAELAQLDWALRRAFDAADAPLLSLADLALIAPDDWATLVLHPQAAASLLHHHHNTLSLWHALDQDLAVPPPEALPQRVGVLVWRVGDQPHFRSLSPMEAVAAHALLQGQSFAEICALLAAQFADEDAAMAAAGILRRWVDDGVLIRPSPG
jgi:hypothetical protein